MEYCNGGTLSTLLNSQAWKNNSSAEQSLFSELVQGYHCLYKSGILHEDLKPDNILIHDGKYKIADFGFATILEEC
jgi:serine/threonine-protein kinase ULK/ATG1